ncbi:glycosyltransferase [Nocardioides sp. SOB77]|uniref:Glycosyltransferase n=1 Tax=Nocardioides oceani TaxID=3058369 RepID=A0ABT8FFZ7_9ACTN|nr:glycosyltransferase [Nocardioides oceani]MDN4173611.1 glycosyltransferase [Nocardioides oceani]
MSGRRTVITAEWLSPVGGSERVVEHLAEAFPEARVFSPVVFAAGAPGIDATRVSAAFRRPERLMQHRQVAAAMNVAAWPVFARTLDRSADLVVASHHLASHWTAVWSDVPHVSYVHTPARYAWFPEVDDRASRGPARAVAAHVRRMDRRAARRVASYAANSAATRDRIREVWDREATVIHPPVDLARFAGLEARGGEPFLLGLSRFIPYKRLDFVIDVADAAGLPLVLVGGGPLEAELRARAERARVPVTFRTGLSDAEVAQLLADATALVYPALEDFGLVPVEAMAAGTPVLALDAAGTAETVVHGVTGALLPDTSDPAAWAECVRTVTGLSAADCRAQADRFSPASFRAAVHAWVDEVV